MELTYNEIKTREVINVLDGKSLGKVIDMTLSFPEGKLKGITVPGRKQGCFARLFDKSKLYIDRRDIKKIGGDVILVTLDCGGTCSENSRVGKPREERKDLCPPPCSPPCPKPCPEQDCGNEFSRIDLSDY